MNNEPQTVKTAWKKYPGTKPPKQHGLPHWEDQSDLVLCVVDDGCFSTRLCTGRLHGLWDDGCGTFVGEEWRNDVGVVINVICWKEIMPQQDPAMDSSAVPEEVKRSPSWKPSKLMRGEKASGWDLPFVAFGVVCVVLMETWRMTKEIWKRYLKS